MRKELTRSDPEGIVGVRWGCVFGDGEKVELGDEGNCYTAVSGHFLSARLRWAGFEVKERWFTDGSVWVVV